MRKRRIITGACGVALLSLAMGGPMAGTAAAQSRSTAWLGVTTQDITSDLREGLDYQGSGVIVNRVVPDSPADRAGLRNGDVIVSLNSRTIDSASELTDLVRGGRVGQSVGLSIVRDGTRRSVTARLAERPDDVEDGMNGSDDSDEPPTPPSAPRAPRTPRAPSAPSERWFNWNGGDFDLPNGRGMALLGTLGRGRLGVQIQDLNEELGDALGVPDGKGVLVTDVVKDTPASRAGIKGGDVIVRVDDKTVEDTNDLRSALRDKEGRVSVTVVRRGARRTVEAELEPLRDVRRNVVRIPDIRTRVQRDRGDSDLNRTDLERQMEELRQQLRDLRRKLDDMDKDKDKDKDKENKD